MPTNHRNDNRSNSIRSISWRSEREPPATVQQYSLQRLLRRIPPAPAHPPDPRIERRESRESCESAAAIRAQLMIRPDPRCFGLCS
jgi:hypothetical protein